MATVLFEVRTTIDKAREEAFNTWYNEHHCPDLLSFPGCISARRYRAMAGETQFQYLAVYEFKNEAAFDAFMKSDHRQRMITEHTAKFGPVAEAPLAGPADSARSVYMQIWPE